MNGPRLPRRRFVRAVATGGAVAATAALAGCNDPGDGEGDDDGGVGYRFDGSGAGPGAGPGAGDLDEFDPTADTGLASKP